MVGVELITQDESQRAVAMGEGHAVRYQLKACLNSNPSKAGVVMCLRAMGPMRLTPNTAATKAISCISENATNPAVQSQNR